MKLSSKENKTNLTRGDIRKKNIHTAQKYQESTIKCITSSTQT